MPASQNASVRKYLKLAEKAYEKRDGNEVVRQCRQILQIQPQHAKALLLMGRTLLSTGNTQQAQELLLRAVNADLTNPESYVLLCETLILQNRLAEAIKVCEQGIRNIPHSPIIHGCMANLMLQCNNAHALPDYIEKVLPQIKGESVELLQCYALGLLLAGRQEEADRVYADVCSRFRVPPSFRVIYETYMPRQVMDQEEIDARRAKLEASLDKFIAEAPPINIALLTMHPLFQLAYHNRDNKVLMQKFTRMLRACAPVLNYTAPHCLKPPRTTDGEIRVGFASHYMHDHPVGRCFRNWLTYLHRHGGFKVILFTLNNREDSTITALQEEGIEVVRATGNIMARQKKVASYELDILIYPDIGMHPEAHYLAMARLAHYQCCLLGHPDTTGIDTIDYYITSRYYEADNAQTRYTETPLLLDSLTTVFTRPEPMEKHYTRAQLGLPTDRTLYTCPMSIQKLHPDMDMIFKNILEKDDTATLILFADHQLKSASYKLRDRILKSCPADRVIFLAWQPLDKLWSIIRESDSVLTTIYFGAGTTAQYAFAYGIPMVTMPDDYVRSRAVMAYYNAMGVKDAPIAHSMEEYVDLAIKLAHDKAYKERLSKEILEGNAAIFEESGHGMQLGELMHNIMAQKLEQYQPYKA